MYANSIDAILLTAPDGRIFAANPEACRILQRSEDEICQIGRDGVVDLTDPRLEIALQERARTGRFKGELNLKRRDGTTFPAEISTTIFADGDGLERTSMIIRDITERKRAEEELRSSEERFRMIFRSSPIPTFVTSIKGPILDVNEAWMREMGFNREEAIGRSSIELGIITDLEQRRLMLADLLKKRRLSNVEMTRRAKSGELRSVLNTVQLVELNGQECVLNMQIDITERKKAEDALRESEGRFRSLFQNTRDAICINTPDGRYIDFNDAWLSLLGYSREEMLKLGAGDVYADPTDRDRFRKKVEQEGFVRDFEVKLRRKDGALRDCLLTSVAWRDREGQILGYQGIVRDITERTRTENELRLSEERFRKIFDSSPIPTLITLPEGPIVDVNDAWLRLTGFTREEAIGRSTTELGMVPDPGQRDQIVGDLLEQRRLSNVEITRLTKSGELRNILNTAEFVELNGQECILSMQVDITERKRLEEEIRGLSQYLELIIENANVWLNVLDKDGNVTMWNKAAEEISGFSKEAVIGHKGVWDSLYPDEKYREQVMKRVREIIDKGITTERETTIRRRDGEARIMSWRSRGLHDANGNSIGYVSLGLDITERRRMENELRQYSEHLEELIKARTSALAKSEEKYHRLADNMSDVVFTIDLEGNYTYASPSAEHVTQYPVARLLAMNMKQLIAPEYYPVILERLKTRVRGEKNLPPIEFEIIRADGQRAPVEMHTSPILTDEGVLVGIQGIARDITQRRKMEERIVKSERLAAIGETAAMVAHDLRNPLQGIASATYVLKDESLTRDEKNDMLQLIENSVEYSDAIVKDLLDYSGAFELVVAETTPREITKRALQAIRVPTEIRLQDLSEDLPAIRVDADRMRRVFINLVENAIDAMPQGGTLTIASKQSGDSVDITFSDTGSGMPREIMENLWTPLVTTKAKGMGLGLAICKRLIDAHGGSISVESRTGEGTTFVIRLPMKPKMVSHA